MVRNSAVHQLRLVVYPIIFWLLYVPPGAGFLPSNIFSKSAHGEPPKTTDNSEAQNAGEQPLPRVSGGSRPIWGTARELRKHAEKSCRSKCIVMYRDLDSFHDGGYFSKEFGYIYIS